MTEISLISLTVGGFLLAQMALALYFRRRIDSASRRRRKIVEQMNDGLASGARREIDGELFGFSEQFLDEVRSDAGLLTEWRQGYRKILSLKSLLEISVMLCSVILVSIFSSRLTDSGELDTLSFFLINSINFLAQIFLIFFSLSLFKRRAG